MPHPILHLHPNYTRGFTLVELMVTVAVIGLLALAAVPAMTSMIRNSRLTGQTEELVASLQLARAEAIRRNARVTVCASTNGSTCASSTSWTEWIVHGMDNSLSTPVDDVIRAGTAGSGVQVSGPAAGIAFKPSGLIDSSQQLEVTLAGQQRCLAVLISGVVSVSKEACP